MLWGPKVRTAETPRLVVVEGRWNARPAAAVLARLSGQMVQSLGPAAAVLVGAVAGGPRPLSRFVFAGAAWLAMLPVARLAGRWLARLGDLLSLGMLFPEARPSRLVMAWFVVRPRREKLPLETPPGESLAKTARRLMTAAHIIDGRIGDGRALRVALLADLAGERLSLQLSERSALQWATFLSDLGMVEVPVAVRDKPGELSSEECEQVQGHVAASLRLAEPLRPWLGSWLRAIEDHHERWSGTGYPSRAVGEDIHSGSRIIAVADAIDALTSPSRNPRPLAVGPALEEIRRASAGQFDPEVVEAFGAVLRLRPSLAIGVSDTRRRLWLMSWWYRKQMLLGMAVLAMVVGGAVFLSRFVQPETAVAGIVVVSTTNTAPEPTTTLPTSTVPRTAPTTVVTSEATTTITILTADLFTPVDDRATTVEDTPVAISVLANDIDPDHFLDPASLEIVASPRQGAAKVITNGRIRYTPKANFSGTDSLRYRICDRDVRCAEAGVTITVTAVNDPPGVGTIALVTLEDTAKSFPLAAADPDTKLLACALTFTPAHGSAFIAADCSTGSYTPAANYAGTDRFGYQVSGGGVSSNGTVEVTVLAVNDAPVVRVISFTIAEGQTRSWTPVIDDPDGPTRQCRMASGPSHGVGQIAADCSSGTYTPVPNYAGTDEFSYVVSDGTLDDVGTVTITVTDVNGPPSAGAVRITTLEDAAKVWTPVVSDPDGNSLACTILTAPADGSATVAGSCASGNYTPKPNFNGSNSFTYRVCDNGGACATATVSVTVTAVNDLPTAGAVSITTLEDTAKAWTPAASDVDGGSLACTILTAPADGSATVAGSCASGNYTPKPNFNGSNSFTYRVCDNGGACATATVSVTVTAVNDLPTAGAVSVTTLEDTATAWTPVVSDADGGSLACTIRGGGPADGSATVDAGCASGTYTPNPNFSGSNSFRYRVCDPCGACATATVSVTVTAVNDPPTAGNVAITASEDGPAVGWTPVVADPDTASLTCSIVSAPANGSATVASSCGSGTYTPVANFSGSNSVTYRVSDGTSTATGTVSVTVTAVNDPPTAGAVSITTAEDTAQAWTPVVADPDSASLTCSIVSAPANGSATVAAGCGSGTYTPAANFSGSNSFTYQVSDGTATATATVSVTVTAVNDPPVAANDSASTAIDTAVAINVIANDSDPDQNTLTVTSSTQGSNGTVSCSASDCTYTPAAGFTGTDTFTYTISDGNGGTSTATVTVTVS